MWRDHLRSHGPCTGASVPSSLLHLYHVWAADWRAAVRPGGSWRGVLPGGLLQVGVRLTVKEAGPHRPPVWTIRSIDSSTEPLLGLVIICQSRSIFFNLNVN